MMRPISKVATEWWDYTTLDREILDDAARLSADDLLQLARPGFAVKFYDTLEDFYLAEALEYITSWKQASESRPAGICGPIGPTEQLPLVARLVNELEIDLRYADALTTADNIMTFRTAVKEGAISQGVYATFMPKPLAGQPGSGMHTHMSLFEGDTNAFYDPGAQYQLSQTGRRFVAGLLKHAPEFTAVTNQYVNSYKRLWGGDEAPSFVSWDHLNRSALVRVPLYKPGKGASARVEYRGIDSAANPYLAFSVMLAAGLKGIEGEYTFDANGDGLHGYSIVRNDRGRLAFIRHIEFTSEVK